MTTDKAQTRRFLAMLVLPVALGLVFFATANHFLAPPDCASYWAWGETLGSRLDFDFSDAYERLEMPTMYVWITGTGRLSNDWPIGSGLALMPAIPFGKAIAHAWVVLWVVGALALWWRASSRRFDRRVRAAALVATVVGTPLAFYCLYGPFFSHPISFAVTTAFLVAWDLTRGGDAPRPLRAWLLLGLLLGFAALVRPQNLLLGVVLIPEAAMALRARAALRPWLCGGTLLGGTALFAFTPQLLAYWAIYGSPLALPKLDEMHWFTPALGPLLTSDFHGVLPWTPIHAVAFIGLLVLIARDRVLGIGLLLALLVQMYVNASNLVWWSGGSFGNRRLADAAILVAYGTSALLAFRQGRSWKTTIGVLIGACCAWTLWLVIAERTGAVPLDRYVAFNTPKFRESMASVWLKPAATAAALTQAARDASPLLPRVIAALLVFLGSLGILHVVARARCRFAIVTGVAAALAVVLVGITAVAAVRNPPVTSEWLITHLPREPKILWDNFIELSFYELERGRADRAENAARRAIALRPDHYSGWWYLAMALREQERWGEAVTSFDKVLELRPEHPRAGGLRDEARRKMQSW